MMIFARSLAVLVVALCCVRFAAAMGEERVHVIADGVETVTFRGGRRMLGMGWGWSWSDLEELGYTCKKHENFIKCQRASDTSDNMSEGPATEDGMAPEGMRGDMMRGVAKNAGDGMGGNADMPDGDADMPDGGYMPGMTPPPVVAPAGCGMGGQPVCSGDQLNGREFGCDFGYSAMDGICVTDEEKEQAQLMPMPQPAPQPQPTPSPVAPTPEPTPTDSGSMDLADNIGKAMGSCSDPMVQAMVAADNQSRGDAGALVCNEAMSQMAMEHSKTQCDTRNMSHDGFNDNEQCDGSSRCAGIADLGYGAKAENVAYHSTGLDQQVDATHTGWMNSPDHRDNIMNPGFTAVGYGFYVCMNAEGSDLPVMYATGLFGG